MRRRREDISWPDGTLYMRRWRLLEWRGWSVRLHRFLAPDWTRDLHDHPWGYFSLMLWGGYVERVPSGVRRHLAPCLLVRRATWRHRVEALVGRCWTLVVTRPPSRKWGFWEGGRFVVWHEYLRSRGYFVEMA